MQESIHKRMQKTICELRQAQRSSSYKKAMQESTQKPLQESEQESMLESVQQRNHALWPFLNGARGLFSRVLESGQKVQKRIRTESRLVALPTWGPTDCFHAAGEQLNSSVCHCSFWPARQASLAKPASVPRKPEVIATGQPRCLGPNAKKQGSNTILSFFQ